MKAVLPTVQVGFTIERFRGIEPSVLLGLTRLLGLEFAEITRTVFAELDRVVPCVRHMQTGFHLPLVHDDGWDFSCADHQAEIDEVIELINTHRQALRITHCIAHPPEPELAAGQVESSVETLLRNLARLDPPLFLENIPGQSMEEFLALYTHAKEALGPKLLGMCFDAPHCYLRGMDPVAQLHALNGHIGCVHLSDCRPGSDEHMAFGLGGVLPIEAILATLRRLRYRGIINLEILPRSIDDLEPAIASYLMVLRALHPRKYVTTKLRLLVVRPLLRHVVP
ncbi:MAG: TIM barrel protein [bacterium]|nr:sugar phosphate isomerase/epimerase [candidate division KSB1 bacterium]MDH7560507.1 TIM barrel protein [bacterium]